MTAPITDQPAAAAGHRSSSGIFIAFEGGEGAGKSTQAKLLAENLTARGHQVLLTRQPGATNVGAKIRSIVLSVDTGAMSDRAEFLLYAADKADHVESVVNPALARGEVVLTDRYVDSTLAYQGAGRKLGLADLRAISQWATDGLRPHLTVVLDVEVTAGLGRFDERDRIEAEGQEFHSRVRELFLELARSDPERYLVLDGAQPIAVLAQRVEDRVLHLIAAPR